CRVIAMTDYERFGDYQPVERGRSTMVLTFLFIGFGIGALTALLLAPTSGRQMRKSIKRRYEDARETVEDLGEQATEYLNRGAEWANMARAKVTPIVRSMRAK